MTRWQVALALASIALLAVLTAEMPRCTAQSPHGPRIEGVGLVRGCP